MTFSIPGRSPYRHFVALGAVLLAMAAAPPVEGADGADAGRAMPILRVAGGEPWINLAAPQQLRMDSEPSAAWLRKRAGDMRPLSLAAADIDHNAIPDLLVGYADSGSGLLAVFRGDETRYPARGLDPPFLAQVSSYALPIEPDYLGSGDFDGNGTHDVVVAARGERSIALLRGDGAGGLAPADLVTVPGRVTALAVGEVNRPDALADLVVAVADGGGYSLLVYAWPEGALRGEPEVFALPTEGTDIVIGALDDHYARDIAVASGSDVVIIRGRDRRLAWDQRVGDAVPEAAVDRLSFDAPVRALAVGRYRARTYRQLAVLEADGDLQIVEARADGAWTLETAEGWQPRAVSEGARIVAARVSALPDADLIVIDDDRSGASVFNLSGPRHRDHGKSSREIAVEGRLIGTHALRAVVPMRLNLDGLDDLVVVTEDVVVPQVLATKSLSTVTVNTNDDNTDCECTGVHCSLRDAICQTNNHPGLDTIEFAYGIGVIRPQIDDLPSVTDPVVIDGWVLSDTQRTEIDGSLCPGSCSGLRLVGSGITVTGMLIHSFTNHGVRSSGATNSVQSCVIGLATNGTAAPNGDGVVVSGDDNVVGGSSAQRNVISGNSDEGVTIQSCLGSEVTGNYIGTDATGTQAIGNGTSGVSAVGAVSGIEIGSTTAPNLISGNARNGIRIEGGLAYPVNVLVVGNTIGLAADGSTDLGNGWWGIYAAWAEDTTVGGTTVAHRNFISGNDHEGIELIQSETTGTEIRGNFIGLNASGNSAVANDQGGVRLAGADGNSVGGSVSGAGNVISGNDGPGVTLGGNGSNPSTDNFVQRNIVGLSAAQNLALANTSDGVLVVGGHSNTVGGSGGNGNIICASGESGVAFYGTSSVPNGGGTVEANRIGVNGSGTAFGNSEDGIRVYGVVSDVVIGGLSSTQWNIIRSNNDAGVAVFDGPTEAYPSRVAIRGNYISGNGGLGVDLAEYPGPDGVTANDADDGDNGPNGYQNFPVITGYDPATRELSFSLNSAASTTFRIELFATTACDASGHGEGEIVLPATTLTTGATGHGAKTVVSPALGETWSITARAIDPDGNTSEFSACFPASGALDEIFSDGFESGSTSAW